MHSECLHYQGKAWLFLIEFLKWYFSKYWQVRTRPVFAQTVTYTNYTPTFIIEVLHLDAINFLTVPT